MVDIQRLIEEDNAERQQEHIKTITLKDIVYKSSEVCVYARFADNGKKQFIVLSNANQKIYLQGDMLQQLVDAIYDNFIIKAK